MFKENPFLLICCSFLFLSVSQCNQERIAQSGDRPSQGSDFSELKSTKNFINEVDTGEESEGENQQQRNWQDEGKTLNNFTRNYSTLPSSKQVTYFLDDQLSPPVGDCNPARSGGQNSSQNVPRILQGARLTYANYFQSCRALDHAIDPTTRPLQGVRKARNIDGQSGVSGGYVRKITDSTEYVESHELLDQLSSDPNYPAPSCRDATERPPVYGYGSRPGVNESGRIDTFQKGRGVASTSGHASGIDCSAFISTAMATSGMKVYKGGQGFRSYTTRGFHSAANDSNSCLSKADFAGSDLIRSGDIVNLKGSHMLMIDDVGSDPLAVNQFAQRGNCQDITIADFDFTYIHSGAIKGGYGPSRVHSSTHSGGRMFENLRLAAVNMCSRIKRGDSEEVNSQDVIPSSSLSVIRHNSSDSACMAEERVELEGEECVKGCENIRQFSD